MRNSSKAILVGLGLVGAGCGLAALGVAIAVPACGAWSYEQLGAAVRKGKEGVMCGVQSAAATVGEITGRAQQKFDDAARAARSRTVH